MESIVRTGVSLPKNVLELIDKYMEISGVKSRSKVISMAIKNLIAERISMEKQGSIFGVFVVVYNEGRGDTVKRFLDVQHKFVEEIISTLHIHATHERCIEVIMIRGNTDKILKLIGDIENIVGVEYTRFIPVLL